MTSMLDDTQAQKAGNATQIIDHLVDALGGDPGCTVRRAVILADIDAHPGTTQAGIMERLGAHKSALNRDIEWLYDYGCITRQQSPHDGREIHIHTCGYSKKNLDLALNFFNFSHKDLQNFLNALIDVFGQHKPTLRDAKIISLLGQRKALSRQDIFADLYDGPVSTDNRAVNNLINAGMVQKKDGS
jgi:DNA-binding MarR family transcriptional regulator